MASTGDTLKRSFLMGYGGGAGRSTWKSSQKNAGAIIAIALAAILAAAPIYFLYKTSKAVTERPINSQSNISRIFYFGLGTTVTTFLLGWALFFLVFALSALVHPKTIPGYNLVPEKATIAVFRNSEMSLARTFVIASALFGSKVDLDDAKETELTSDKDAYHVANLVVRLSVVVVFVGFIVGLKQRANLNRQIEVMNHNEKFMADHSLDISSDGVLSDCEGNTFRSERRSQNRMELLALHRRNMRGYLDFDDDGRMRRWSGLVRKGTV